MFGFLTKRRRAELRARPSPVEWRAILRRNLPLFGRLTPADQEELLGHVQVFLAEKNFEGCGGLALTDEIKVTIAAQACLLLLHRETDYYPQLVSILVYPSGYIARRDQPVDEHLWDESNDHLLGHTHSRLDSVVLAWDAARHGAADPADGANLVIHEFAHQLDFEDASTDGAPVLETRAEYLAWARIMSREFEELRAADEAGAASVFDSYGASDPAEFFAVVTEAFFEKPRAVRAKHPELYAVLSRFYRQDPASYSAEAAPG